jgi:hypothetical protein
MPKSGSPHIQQPHLRQPSSTTVLVYCSTPLQQPSYAESFSTAASSTAALIYGSPHLRQHSSTSALIYGSPHLRQPSSMATLIYVSPSMTALIYGSPLLWQPSSIAASSVPKLWLHRSHMDAATLSLALRPALVLAVAHCQHPVGLFSSSSYHAPAAPFLQRWTSAPS